MKYILATCFVGLFIACVNNKKGDTNNKKMNELLSCKSEFEMEDGEQANGYYTDRTKFIKPYCTAQYLGNDTLKVETLHEINSCAKTKGVIEFSNDTLYLKTKIVGEEMCTSVEFHTFQYLIVKDNIKQYKVAY